MHEPEELGHFDVTHAEVLDHGHVLRVQWSDGLTARFHGIWLRDNGRDSATRSHANQQKLITFSEIPRNCHITSCSVSGNQVAVLFSPEDKEVFFYSYWLRAHNYDTNPRSQAQGLNVSSNLILWDSQLDDKKLDADYNEIVSSNNKLLEWLIQFEQYGFAKINNGPNEAGSLLEIIKRFGYVRETNYGQMFDVRTQVDPGNLAYTNLGLQAHTDNPYRDPVPTLQLLYCLENSAQGGESQVIDGFRAAQRLFDEDRESFEILSGHSAEFQYVGNGDVHLQASRPLLETDPDGRLLSVRFNNRSIAPLKSVPFKRVADYYAAYRRFDEIINDPAMTVEFKLAPGDSFLLDNTRVLHGRSAYTSQSGHRWLQGCYADKDSLHSKRRVLQSQQLALTS